MRKVIGVLATACALAGALAVTATAQNPAQTCVETGNVFVVEFGGEVIELEIGSHGGCVSSYATGDLSGSAFVANCKGIEAEVGGYPYRFYGNPPYEATNRADCVYFLRAFHTGALPPGP